MARKSNANVMTKTCTKTGFTITGTIDEIATYFYRDKTSNDGFATWCKEAEKSYNNAYHNALKNAGVTRASQLDDKTRAKFNRAMRIERVKRGTYSNRKSRNNDDAQTTTTTKNASKSRNTTRKSRTFKNADNA